MRNYAGFWIRVLAYLIDTIILMIVFAPLAFLFGENLFDMSPDAQIYSVFDLISFIVGISYFVGFETSNMQGTPGKRALGLIVVDHDGATLTVGRAIGRYFAKILSALILLIGYIMVAFTERKQGLHDMICSTLVLKADPGQGLVDPEVFQ